MAVSTQGSWTLTGTDELSHHETFFVGQRWRFFKHEILERSEDGWGHGQRQLVVLDVRDARPRFEQHLVKHDELFHPLDFVIKHEEAPAFEGAERLFALLQRRVH